MRLSSNYGSVSTDTALASRFGTPHHCRKAELSVSLAFVGVALTEFERGDPFVGDYAAALAALQERIAQLQLAQIVHGRRSIILFEGLEGSCKRGSLKALGGGFDPCSVAVHCVDNMQLQGRHWLAPYWSRLPRTGETAIFFRSWYGDAVERRALGELVDKPWARTCDEINEFEAQQTDHGTLLIKLFFHTTAAVQAERLRKRKEDPWLRALAASSAGSRSDRDEQLGAWTEMFKRSDTRWARWTVIDAGDERAARIAALNAVAAALEKALPADPPLAIGDAAGQGSPPRLVSSGS